MTAMMIAGTQHTTATEYAGGNYLTTCAIFEVTLNGTTQQVLARRVHKPNRNDTTGKWFAMLWCTDTVALAKAPTGSKLHPTHLEIWQDGGVEGTKFTVASGVRVRNARNLWAIVAWDDEKYARYRAEWYNGGTEVRAAKLATHDPRLHETL